tara:strand:- start:4664 stop:4912 length:249 start_codon:yes stop_codon:yes gene_type:complete
MAKSFSSLGQNPFSFSKDKIVSVYAENGNLYGIKENGSKRHMGSAGSNGIRDVSTSNGHAIVTDGNGNRTMINLETMARRSV